MPNLEFLRRDGQKSFDSFWVKSIVKIEATFDAIREDFYRMNWKFSVESRLLRFYELGE